MRRRIAIVAVTVLQLALLAVLLTWHIRDASRRGWTGVGYSPVVSEDTEALTSMVPFGAASREINLIAPGSPAARAGTIERGLLESVNGIDVAEIEALHELSRALGKGDEVTYRFVDDGDERSVTLVLESPFRSPYLVANLTTSIVGGLVWLAISLLVYWGRPESRQATVFFLLCSVATTMYFVWGVSEQRAPDLRGIMPLSTDLSPYVFLIALAVLSVLFTNLLLHLALLFPKPRPVVERWPRVFHWVHMLPFTTIVLMPLLVLAIFATRSPPGVVLYAAALIVALFVMTLQIARAARREGWLRAVADRPWRSVLSALLVSSLLGPALRLVPDSAGVVLGMVFGLSVLVVLVGWATLYAVLTCVSLYRSYRESGVEARNQVRWPLWGTLTALGGSVVLTLFSIVIGYVWADAGPVTYAVASGAAVVTKLAYTLIPIGFAFAIVKYRLLDIDVIIKKTVVYSAATGIVLALYLAFAGISGLVLVRTAGLQGETATVFATLAVVALFVPIRNRVQAFVDRRFFQREHDLEAAREKINQLAFTASDIDDVLPKIVESTQQALHCRSVVVFTRVGQHLRPAASVGLPDERVRAAALPVDAPLLAAGQRVIVVDRDRAAAPEVLRAIRPAVLAPATRAGEPVGMLAAGPKLGGEPYDEDDQAFLGAIAEQLVLALGRSDQSRSREELKRAREIQRSLLPEKLPQIDGVEVTARWQPAREVSGDYYDVLRLGEDRLALCVGDVVGKGMPAALLMSSLQAALKAVAHRVDSTTEICTQVRDVMLQSLAGGTFVTFFLCIIDRSAGRLTYTNAGHNPPLLVRADGTLVKLDVGGPILARIAAEMPYQEASVAVAPGDRIVLYTDGVTEAMDADEEMFEEQRLETLVLEHRGESASDLERAITDAVLEHAGGVLQDDLTLVVAAVVER